MLFGSIDIYSNYKDHYASNISEGFLKTTSRYTKTTHNGIYVGSEDLQKNAIQNYYEVNKRLNTYIRDVIKQIEEEVDKLDINSIIDSYKTTVSEWTKTKVGNDDHYIIMIDLQHRAFKNDEKAISELVQFLIGHHEGEWYSQTVYLMVIANSKGGIAARDTVCYGCWRGNDAGRNARTFYRHHL